MDWESVNERLAKRGELLLSLEFVDSYDGESHKSFIVDLSSKLDNKRRIVRSTGAYQ